MLDGRQTSFAEFAGKTVLVVCPKSVVQNWLSESARFLPGLNAVNLHFLDALGGGQFSSLRLDPLAKGKAQQLLDIGIAVPRALAPRL